jgi:alkylation response protein AidB-like acyl-CoA dehydrogenase
MSRPDPASLELRLLAAVARVRPVAAARAEASDREGTLHPEVVAALRAEGLFGFAAPREVGGEGAGPLAQLTVVEATAYADSSAGWALMIGALLTATMGSYLGDTAVRRIFRDGMPITAGHQVPMGRAVPVAGGFEITGRWAFGSGIRHADWVFCPAVIDTGAPPEGPPPMISFAVPAAAVQIEPTWSTALLRGSGSDHYRLESAFVEEAFTCPFPAAPRRRGGASFELPFVALVAAVHIGFALGVARRALDEVAEQSAPRRVLAWTQTLLRDDRAFRVDFGRASAELAAARALSREVIAATTERVERGDVLTAGDWANVRSAVTYATEVAARATTFALRAGGASSMSAKSVLERCFRDAHAALQHVAASDDAYDLATRVRLGEPAQHVLHLPRPKATAM